MNFGLIVPIFCFCIILFGIIQNVVVIIRVRTNYKESSVYEELTAIFFGIIVCAYILYTILI